jgi:hypothetical protein
LKRGDNVVIRSNAPIQEVKLQRGKYVAVFWIGRRGKKEKIFKTEREARLFAGLKV